MGAKYYAEMSLPMGRGARGFSAIVELSERVRLYSEELFRCLRTCITCLLTSPMCEG